MKHLDPKFLDSGLLEASRGALECPDFEQSIGNHIMSVSGTRLVCATLSPSQAPGGMGGNN